MVSLDDGHGGAAPRFTARLTGLTKRFERTLAREVRVWRDEGYRTDAPRWRGKVVQTKAEMSYLGG